VITRDHGEMKNSTLFAMSSCGGMRPSGMLASISWRTSSRVIPRASDSQPRKTSTAGPPIQPGATQLTRTPVGPSSIAIVRAALWMADFDAE
jgi:hypothetical protein